MMDKLKENPARLFWIAISGLVLYVVLDESLRVCHRTTAP